MATAFIVWDRKLQDVAAPLEGVFRTQAEADAVIARFKRKGGKHTGESANLERVSVNVD